MAVSDKLTPAGEGPTELPKESGSIDAPRFEPDDQWLHGADSDLQKAAVWRWFATRYEDPRDAVPHDTEGHYLYGDSEPVHADEALAERFGQLVPPEVLEAVHAAICSEVGNDWALKRLDKAGG